jgi:tetratricopeptide (TPR) repeat protein
LNNGKTTDAIEVFKLNVREFPKSSNVYDSLGEAYMKVGKREPAIENYKKSLELDPKNANAEETIKRLQSDVKKFDPKVFETYVGEYESPLGILTVSTQGDKLFIQPGGSSKEELIAEAETRFAVPSVGAVVVFAKDESGRVTRMVVRVRGEDFEAKKIK